MPWESHVWIVICTIVPYALRVRRPGADAFAPTRAFAALYLVWFALGSMNLVSPDPDTPLWDPLPADLWLYIGGGFAAYFLGCLVLPKARGPEIPPDLWRGAIQSWNHRRAALLGLALLSVIFASYAILVAQGALAALTSNPGEARVEWGGSRVAWSAYYSALLAFVPLSLLYVWARHDVSASKRRLVYALIILLLAMTLMLGNRGVVLEPAVLALLIFHYARKRLSLRIQFTLALAGLLFLGVGGIYRDYLQYGPTHFVKYVNWGFPLWSLPVTYMFTYIRDSVLTFQQLRGVVPVFSDFTKGGVLLAPLATVLPGHQDSPDLIFKRLLGNDFVGFGQPATLLGSLYVDGGIGAVIIGMYVFGLLSRSVYTRLQMNPTPYRLLLHVWIAHVALFSLFTSLFPAITTIFVPLLLYGLVAALSTGQLQPV